MTNSHLIFGFSLALFCCSCGKGKSEDLVGEENLLKNLSITLDTEMINSKGKLFDLRRGPLHPLAALFSLEVVFLHKDQLQILPSLLSKNEIEVL